MRLCRIHRLENSSPYPHLSTVLVEPLGLIGDGHEPGDDAGCTRIFLTVAVGVSSPLYLLPIVCSLAPMWMAEEGW